MTRRSFSLGGGDDRRRTPAHEGTFTFTVKGTDQHGQPLQQTYRITVGPPPPLTDTTPSRLMPGQVSITINPRAPRQINSPT